MKALGLMGLALAAFGSFAGAQEPAQKETTRLNVSFFENKRWRTYPASAANAKGIIFDDHGTLKQKRLKAPYIVQSPAELSDALDDYRSSKLSDALKKCEKLRSEYAAFRDVDGNPAMQAALCELDCAMRLQDWKHLRDVAEKIARKMYGSPAAEQGMAARVAYQVAESMLMEDAAQLAKRYQALGRQVAKFAALDSEDGKADAIPLRPYGWYCYCLGRMAEAQIPAAERKGSITDANRKMANEAIDRLCQFVACSHGSAPELELDALLRATHLLYAMPGVAEFANSRDAMGRFDAARWAKAPTDFKDAVALAHLVLKVYDQECKDEVITKLAPRFFNAREGEKKDGDESAD